MASKVVQIQPKLEGLIVTIADVDSDILLSLPDIERVKLRALMGAETIGFSLCSKPVGHGVEGQYGGEMARFAHIDILEEIKEIVGPKEFARLYWE